MKVSDLDRLKTDGMMVVATKHAMERLELYKLSFRKAVYMFHNGIEEKEAHSSVKAKKYTGRKAKYRSYGTFIFTYKVVNTVYKGATETVEPFVLLLTATNKLINYKNKFGSVSKAEMSKIL